MIAWFAAFAAAAPSDKPREEEIVDGLPPWMEHGEQVRFDVVRDLLASGNTVGALDILRVMRADGVESPLADLYQGAALRLDGVTGEAERLLLQAQKKLRDDPRPSAELCLLYADDRRLDEAIEACKRATRADAGADASMFNNLAFLLLSAGRAEEALPAAERAIELDGGDAVYRNNLALVQATLGREDQAFRTLQSTMRKADAAYMVGVAVEGARGPEAAAHWFEKALQHEPDHELTRRHLSSATTEPVPAEPSTSLPPAPEGAPEESP
jgi:tetratricopeptide (TPR) repeat protein